jgi:hydrogenase maturation protease
MNSKTLIFGIGNCGREDDGLGWAFLDQIKDKLPANFDIEYRYQLQVEDAELSTNYDTIIFIDAHTQLFKEGYTWEKCMPKATESFTTHELDPQSVLYLTDTIYNKKPTSYILGISGKDFRLAMGLSDLASSNLIKALDFFNTNILI